MHITFRQLQAFRAVVTTGSTAAAAQKVFISQPAVSRLIHALEDQVGFKIFVREKGRLHLTESGQMLFEESERILDAVDDFGSIAVDIREHRTARIRLVGTPTVVGSAPLARAVAAFVDDEPNVRVLVEARTRLEIEQYVASGRSDLGIILLPTDHPGTRCETFCHSRMVAVHRPGLLTSTANPLPLETAAEHPLILIGSASHVRTMVDHAFFGAGITPSIKVESRTSITSCNLAAEGVGVALVDELSCVDTDADTLTVTPLTPDIPLSYGLLTRVGTPDTPLIASLKTKISECFQKALKTNNKKA